MIPPTVIQIRRELCQCKGVNHADPCAACPNGHFGRYEQTGCEEPDRDIPTTQMPTEAMPRNQWPIWAKALTRLATKQDTGIGDVVRRTIGDASSDAFKKWYQKLFGKTCGCETRQAEWNRLYPLNEQQ